MATRCRVLRARIDPVFGQRREDVAEGSGRSRNSVTLELLRRALDDLDRSMSDDVASTMAARN
jgi:hypothetical protein